ncbi:MAG: hypothetical protein KAH54_10020 [Candidatus Sabulitectum sp.]|nr:hypothetical protein [Candidatus Sabulitectum sp.]
MSEKSRPINPFTLGFQGDSKHLESSFRNAYFDASRAPIRTALISLVLFYMLFSFLDRSIDPDSVRRFMVIRYYIIAPSALLFMLFTRHRYYRSVFQPATAFLMIFGAAGIVYMIITGNSTVRMAYGSGFYLVLISLYAFLRIRFVWALPSGIIILSGYLVSVLIAEDIPGNLLALDMTFLGSFAVLGSIVCYNLELLTRKEYLARADLELERDNLEKSVLERTEDLERSHLELLDEMKEREKLERKFQQVQRLESLGLLAAGVAHDFNNILAGIQGFVIIARNVEGISSEVCTYLDEVEIGARRATELTSQLLAFSRQQKMETILVDPNQLIRGLSSMLERIIGEHIKIYLDLSDDIGSVLADPGQLEQVITNLSVNARDAMSDGGVLRISTMPGVGGTIFITVSDTGKGMAPETIERIFEPFFTTKETGKGTGLGLATSFGIIEQLKGTLSASSAEGTGSIFTVELPLATGTD